MTKINFFKNLKKAFSVMVMTASVATVGGFATQSFYEANAASQNYTENHKSQKTTNSNENPNYSNKKRSSESEKSKTPASDFSK